MRINLFKRFKLKAIASALLMLSMLLMPVKGVLALDAPLQSLDINGVRIYTTVGGYNAGHGISGVTFDDVSKVLTLTNATLERIHASGDLDILLVGTNTVTATTDSSALLAMGGDITITGDSADLTISALDSASPAISIGDGGRLTIGDVGTVITVTVSQGFLVNCDDIYIVDGNTFNTPGGGDPPPPPATPTIISIGDTVVIDETADPQVLSNSGTGWTIEQNPYSGYQLDIDASLSPSIPHITFTGNGSMGIYPYNGDVTIQSNASGPYYESISIEGTILFGMGPDVGDLYLQGGIIAGGSIIGGDGDVFIGSELSKSWIGAIASDLILSFGSMTIHAESVGLSGVPTMPDPINLEVVVQQNAVLTVVSDDNGATNTASILVLGGGKVDITALNVGSFTPQAGYWAWTEFTGTDMENLDPFVVDCVEGTDLLNKYILTTGEGSFVLESTAKALFQLGFNYDDSDDSRVVNGTVNVIAANGFKFVSGGYYDFSIEEGTEVTIELVPNYGYQYVSGGINGVPTSPEPGRASYTFIMPANHVHISAIFEQNPDIIDLETSKISAASITMPVGEINGNAELLIDEASEFDTTGFVAAAGDFEVGSYLNLSLNELIYKGSTTDAWRTGITDLNSDSSVTLSLGDDLKGHAEYKVIRHHNGTITELDATYDPATGTLSFDTDGFSIYALAYNDPENPNTYDGVLGSVALGVSSLMGLIGIGFVTRKKK